MHDYGGYIALQQLSQTNLNNGMQKTSVEIHSFSVMFYGFQCNIVTLFCLPFMNVLIILFVFMFFDVDMSNI